MAQRIKLPYERGPGGTLRPYLTLLVEGPSESQYVRGLLDSGADISVLPHLYVERLGLEADDLVEIPLATTAGTKTAAGSRRPIVASIPGYDAKPARIRPLFLSEVGEATWGRDFMSFYSVAFAERDKQFSLYAYDD